MKLNDQKKQHLRNRSNQNNYTMKYVGVTFGKIGILSHKIPLEAGSKIEKIKYKAPLPSQPKKVKLLKEDQNIVKNKEK